jgi:hypothetical protein
VTARVWSSGTLEVGSVGKAVPALRRQGRRVVFSASMTATERVLAMRIAVACCILHDALPAGAITELSRHQIR